MNGENKKKYDQLHNAVVDLLSELRITPLVLDVMASGYSPDYSGVINGNFENPHCKVQLSQVVASKLSEACGWSPSAKMPIEVSNAQEFVSRIAVKSRFVTNLVDRAARAGLPDGMGLTEFEDYIRSLYPECYKKRTDR